MRDGNKMAETNHGDIYKKVVKLMQLLDALDVEVMSLLLSVSYL